MGSLPYSISICERSEIKDFVEQWHYSKSINGLRTRFCFKLCADDKIIGAALFGALGMANNWKKFAVVESDVVELHRLCCIDDTMKNTESYFIGRCIRWLKQNTDVKVIVSYADENHNHSGIIYKATNFHYDGVTPPSKMIQFGNRFYHDKAVRTKYKGELKPFARRIANALLSGDARYVTTKFKHRYIYTIARK